MGFTETDLYNNLSIEQIGNTRYLQFSYRDADPARARAVVNRVTDAYWMEMGGLGVPGTNTIYFGGAGYPIDMWVLQYARVAKALGPALVRNGLVALAIGLMLGIGLALLVERREERSRRTLSTNFA